jgi:alkylation response protein AidB-like acyl-CoA dehydrogenase
MYLGLVLQEAGRALAPLPLHCSVVAASAVARAGSTELANVFLPPLIRGDSVMTWAFTERDPRFLPETVQMSARADGDAFVLNGNKMFVDFFPASDQCLVACRTAAASAQSEGLSLFLVDSKSAGISVTRLNSLAKDALCEVHFKDVRVPKARLVGTLHEAWPVISDMLDLGAVLLCTQMLGATRMDAEMAIEHAKFREAFGQPIGAFQSIQHTCADMIIWIDGGELLAYEALWKMDQGMPASVEVSQAKAFCNEKCVAVVRNSQSIHGGIGFMMEFDLHLWYRRVTSWTMRLGTSFEHRERVARALLDGPGRVILGGPVPPVPF